MWICVQQNYNMKMTFTSLLIAMVRLHENPSLPVVVDMCILLRNTVMIRGQKRNSLSLTADQLFKVLISLSLIFFLFLTLKSWAIVCQLSHFMILSFYKVSLPYNQKIILFYNSFDITKEWILAGITLCASCSLWEVHVCVFFKLFL